MNGTEMGGFPTPSYLFFFSKLLDRFLLYEHFFLESSKNIYHNI